MSKSEAASIAISSKSEDVSIGKSYNFNIKNKVKGSTYKWSTSDKSIATVNSKNGVAKGVKVGTAIISCKITLPNKTTKTVKATFNVRPDATAVAINNPVSEIKLGTSYDFNRTMTPANSANKTYWIVKDYNGTVIANTREGVGANIMSSQGVFTPKTLGDYTITAQCWRSKTASVMRAESDSLKVTVIPNEITKIEAIETTLYTDTNGQTLKVKVDGVEMTAAELGAAGYTVTFTATEANFIGDSNTSTTGIVKNITTAGEFKYSVMIQKGSTVLVSSEAKVTVLDKSSTAVSALTSVKIGTDKIDAITSGKIVVGEDVEIKKVVATLMDGRKNVDLIELGATLDYDTSDATVATVDAATKTISAVAPGNVTITIKSTSAASMKINLQVVSADRKLNTIKYAGSSTSIVSDGVEKELSVTAYDQYGDTWNTENITTDVTCSDAYASGKVIASAEIEKDVVTKGKATVTVTTGAVDAVGSGVISFTAAASSKNVGTIAVTVTRANTTASYKGVASATEMDLNAAVDDKKSITFSIQKLVGSSYAGYGTVSKAELVYPDGTSVNYTTNITNNKVEVTRADIIEKATGKTDSDVEVDACTNLFNKVDTYTMKLTDDKGKVYAVTFKMINTAPRLAKVSFNSALDIKVSNLMMTDLITSVSASGELYDGTLRFEVDAVDTDTIYVFYDAAASTSSAGFSYEDGDVLLGYIKATTIKGTNAFAFANTSSLYLTNGTITISMTEGDSVQIDAKSTDGKNVGTVRFNR